MLVKASICEGLSMQHLGIGADGNAVFSNTNSKPMRFERSLQAHGIASPSSL